MSRYLNTSTCTSSEIVRIVQFDSQFFPDKGYAGYASKSIFRLKRFSVDLTLRCTNDFSIFFVKKF